MICAIGPERMLLVGHYLPKGKRDKADGTHTQGILIREFPVQ